MTRAPHGRSAPGPGDARRARPGAAHDRFRPCGAPTRGLRGRTVPAAAVRRRCAEPPPAPAVRLTARRAPAHRPRPSEGLLLACPAGSSIHRSLSPGSAGAATGSRPPTRHPGSVRRTVRRRCRTRRWQRPSVLRTSANPASCLSLPGGAPDRADRHDRGCRGKAVSSALPLRHETVCRPQPLRRGADRVEPRRPRLSPGGDAGPPASCRRAAVPSSSGRCLVAGTTWPARTSRSPSGPAARTPPRVIRRHSTPVRIRTPAARRGRSTTQRVLAPMPSPIVRPRPLRPGRSATRCVRCVRCARRLDHAGSASCGLRVRALSRRAYLRTLPTGLRGSSGSCSSRSGQCCLATWCSSR